MSLEIFIGKNGTGKSHELDEIRKKAISSIKSSKKYPYAARIKKAGIDNKDEISYIENEISENEIFVLTADSMLQDQVKFLAKKKTLLSNYISKKFNEYKVDNKKAIKDSLDQLNIELKKFSTSLLNNLKNNDNEIAQIITKTEKISDSSFDISTAKVKNKNIFDYNKLNPSSINPFSFNSEYTKNYGSGQESYFLLLLANTMPKNSVIILDEPERFCHPSLLNQIADVINKLSETKEVHIATHSSQLLKMLNFDMENLIIKYKDPLAITPEKIYLKQTYGEVIKATTDQFKLNDVFNTNVFNLSKNKYYSNYYLQPEYLDKLIRESRNELMDMFFDSNVYFIEGVNDRFFLEKWLKKQHELYPEKDEYSDYVIICTFGKYMMPLYLAIFNNIKSQNKKSFVMFDMDGKYEDDERDSSISPSKKEKYIELEKLIDDLLERIDSKQENWYEKNKGDIRNDPKEFKKMGDLNEKIRILQLRKLISMVDKPDYLKVLLKSIRETIKNYIKDEKTSDDEKESNKLNNVESKDESLRRLHKELNNYLIKNSDGYKAWKNNLEEDLHYYEFRKELDESKEAKKADSILFIEFINSREITEYINNFDGFVRNK